MRGDRTWMYNRLDPNNKGITEEFISGIDEFIDFAIHQKNFVSNGNIRCPCSRCDNGKFLDIDVVKTHLYKYGFVPEYYQWVSHGEPYVPMARAECNINLTSQLRADSVPTINPYCEMVLEAAGPYFDPNVFDGDEVEVPNCEAEKFYEMLKIAEEPLFDGCNTHSTLSVVTRLLNIKSEFNMSESCFNRILQLIKELLPKDAKLPHDLYKTKQMVSKLGLGYERIHICVNGCILYYKEHKDRITCPVCNHPRYKPTKKGDGRKHNVPYKVLRYMPLTPRLQRLYMSSKTAKHMTWHSTTRRELGVMSHPCDGEAWKHFDQCHPYFAAEPRNVRLALASDGFSPYGQMSHNYSCWPVIVTPYNLPPGMCMSTTYMFLTLVIPGPKSPCQNIDLYLQPLIDELKTLWEVGVETYDSFKKQNFQMRAALMWTINDFPAYGMLSGWSTHGVLSCPICMDQSKAFRLEKGKKISFFDCHRQFLPFDHAFRKDRKSFKKGQAEKSSPPRRLSGEEVWDEVRHLPSIMEKTGTNKLPGFGKKHNWTKRSMFWELPYWSTNLIRHNLDVMHIEKNMFDNIFNTIMDDKVKTKDNDAARDDLSLYCDRPELELKKSNDGKRRYKPKAAYTLGKEQKKLVCEWVTNLRLPDGYASNLSKCVDIRALQISRMKSHDCHVFMEKLLPIALRDLIPEPIWNAITEVSIFFKDLCSTVLRVEQMQRLTENIVVTLCKLEKIFPPGFFDSMEHLPIHLPYEAKVGGPVQYRWMYPFERILHDLKKMVKNKARVEGSICEAYLMQEISNFGSYYFLPHIESKLNKAGRNDDSSEADAPDGCLSIFTYPGRGSGKMRKRFLSDEEFNAATIYVLLNCAEIEPFVEIFENEMAAMNPNITDEEIESKTNKEFAAWLKEYVFDTKHGVLDSRVKYLASGPLREVQTWPQYNVNGYRFHTITYGSNKTTMNSGVCIKGKFYGDSENDYYGLLNDIIELEYHNPSLKRTTLVLFKCDWFDPTINKGWKVHNRYGLVDINRKRRFSKYEPFILAEQSQQVYFAEYASRRKERADWCVVYKIKARSMIDSPDLAYQEDEVSIMTEPDVNDRIHHLSVEGEENEEELVVESQDINCEFIDDQDDQENKDCEDSEESEFESQEEDSEEENDENIQYDDNDEDGDLD